MDRLKKLRILNSPILILSFLIIIFLFFTFFFFLKIPPVWPDEALFADTALNILKHHPAGTALLKFTLEGAEQFGFGYPPLFFYLLAAWFKMVGFSILHQRALTLIISLIFLLTLYLLTRQLLQNKNGQPKMPKTLPFLTIILLLSDIAFLKASLISRPEIVVLLAGSLSIYLFIKAEELTAKKGGLFLFLCGFILGIGFLFHYFAIIFIFSFLIFQLLKYKIKLFRQANFFILVLSFLLPIIIWLILIKNDLTYLINNLILSSHYRGNGIIWVRTIFTGTQVSLKIIYTVYMLIWLKSLNLVLSSKTVRIRLLAIILSISWLFSYLWHTEFVFICVIVFTYLIFTMMIYENFRNNLKKIIYSAAFMILISLNIYNLSKNLSALGGEKYSYSRFLNNILINIPDKKSVYLSSIPDAYFGFRPGRGNILYSFPVLPTTQAALIKELDESDYIIYNSSLEALVTENTVTDYIKKNQEQIIQVGGENQYKAEVVKLIPKEQRNKIQ